MNILINNTIFLGGIYFLYKIQKNFKINIEILINVCYYLNIEINKGGNLKMIKLTLNQLKVVAEKYPTMTILQFVEYVKQGKINL